MASQTATVLRKAIRSVAAADKGAVTDRELLNRFVENADQLAFASLVGRHTGMVLGVCRRSLAHRQDAEDVCQATFLLLARKAKGVRWRSSVANWLYATARKVAHNARVAAERRARREVKLAVRGSVEPVDRMTGRELLATLDEELDKLPSSYREPLILCYLEGLTRDEAAIRLGIAVDTLKVRIHRGRKRLHIALTKSGCALGAGLLALAATSPAGASPLCMVESVQAMIGGRVPPTVATIAEGVAVNGFVKKSVVGALTLAATIAIGIGLGEPRTTSAGPQPEKAKVAAESPKKADAEPAKMVTVSGIVVSKDGQGICTTRVVIRRQDQKVDGGVNAITGPDGRFVAIIPEITTDTPMIAVANFGEGFKTGWHTWNGPAPKELRIKIVEDDVPIQGRLLDLEGKPVAGVTLTVHSVHAFPDASPQAYIDWMARKLPRPTQNTLHAAPPDATAKTVSGADGKFQLKGIGRDRVVQLLVSGPAITYEYIYPATVKALADPAGPRTSKVYPATFDHIVTPARIIRGTARDADTGKPVVGLKVNGFGGAATTTTDKDGRYELPGNKKGPRYAVFARPNDGSVYFPTMAEAADIAGLAPLEMDLKVNAGVPVRGRLKDAATGKPVIGTIQYWAHAGNSNVASIPLGATAGEYYTLDVRTKPDGTFTCAALPGPGFLTVNADGWYQSARVDPKGFFEPVGMPSDTEKIAIAVGGMALSSLTQESFQAIRLLKIDTAKMPDEQVIELIAAEPIRGRFVGPDGKQLEGVKVRGLRESGDNWSNALTTTEFTARPPHPDRPRRLTFRHDGEKLVGTMVVATGSEKPVEFKLGPWATITGRLLDADGKSIGRASIFARAGKDSGGKTVDTVVTGSVFSDDEGRFQIDGLLPDVTYEVHFREFKPKGRGGPVTKEVGLKPGEKRDLGEVRVPGREP